MTYACRHILFWRFASFSITLNDICPAGQSDLLALRGNIGHPKATLTSLQPCAF
jgi:hypothetical protein